jgi:hypothetical protein
MVLGDDGQHFHGLGTEQSERILNRAIARPSIRTANLKAAAFLLYKGVETNSHHASTAQEST